MIVDKLKITSTFRTVSKTNEDSISNSIDRFIEREIPSLSCCCSFLYRSSDCQKHHLILTTNKERQNKKES